MRAYRAGTVAIANAPGTGVADDKWIYQSVPNMIRFYLGEEPIIPNVPTYSFANRDMQSEVVRNPEKWVVKRVDGSGGYGMLIGSTATEAEAFTFFASALPMADQYIVQPVLRLSECPTLDAAGQRVLRHVDLRPYVLAGDTVRVVPGGLTRVALEEGSLVVNSSQGGGTKDTWIVADGVLDAANTIPSATLQSLQMNVQGGAV
jgi:uncharacterized circularly permuted ATP-grasp superfamily protein